MSLSVIVQNNHGEMKCTDVRITYSFDVLLQVQIHDDSIESQNTDEFEETEQLELLGLLGVQEYLQTKQAIRYNTRMNKYIQ